MDYVTTFSPLLFNGLVREVRLDGQPLYPRVAVDGSVGNPGPSLKVRWSRYPFRLAVRAGARRVTVDVRQPVATAVRPKLVVKANPAIGLNADVTATAGTGTDWQTLEAAFTATANGGVKVWLVNEDFMNPCWFDNVKVT